MNCNEVNENISMYLDNVLEEEKQLDFEQHVHTCEFCRNELAEMTAIMNACRDIPDEDLPESFKPGLHEKLVKAKQEQESHKKTVEIRKRYVKICASIAACALLVVLVKGTWGYIGSQTKSTADRAETAGYPQKAAAELPKAQSAEAKAGNSEVKGEQTNTVRKSNVKLGALEGVADPSSAPGKNTSPPTASTDKTSGREDTVILQKDQIEKSTDDTSAVYGTIQRKTAASKAGLVPENPLSDTDAGRSTNITLKSDIPEAEMEKIKAGAVSQGAVVLLQPTSEIKGLAVSPEPVDKTEHDVDGTVSSSTYAPVTIEIKIENRVFDQWIDELKKNYSQSDLKIGTVNVIDFTDQMDTLNRNLGEINRKIKEAESNKISTEEMEQLRNTAASIQAEINEITRNANYIVVVISIDKKT